MSVISKISDIDSYNISSLYNVSKAVIKDVMGYTFEQYYRVPIVSTRNDITVVNTVNYPIGSIFQGSTSSQVECPITTSGFISNIRVQITVNSLAASQTAIFRLIKNGSPTNLSVTINSTDPVGTYEDSTSPTSVKVDPGDYVYFEVVKSDGSSITFTSIAVDYLTKKGVHKSIAYDISNGVYSANNADRYHRIVGGLGSIVSSENDSVKFYVPANCTLENLRINIASNARTTDTTFTVRVNSVDTSVAITVAAGATGWMSSGNTASITSGDYISLKIRGGAEATSISFIMLTFDLTPTTNGVVPYIMGTTGTSLSTNSTRNSCISTSINFTATASTTTRYRTLMKGSGTMSHLYNNVNTNAGTVEDSVYVVRANNSNTSLTNSYGPGVTGLKSDTSNTYNYVSGDSIDLQVSRTNGGGTGNHTIGSWSIRLTVNPENEP